MSEVKKKILVSQPLPPSGNSPYYAIAEKYGYDLEFRQLIKVVPLEAPEFRKQRIDILEHSTIVFTSRSAIDNFFALCKELRVVMPDDMRYVCQSESVALYLQKFIVYRKRKVSFPQDSSALSDMVALIAKHPKETYFIPVPEDNGNNPLAQMLTEQKIKFDCAVMYRTVTREFEEPLPFDHDIILFFSPYGIRSVKELYPEFKQEDRVIGAFGQLTSKAITEAGLRVDFEAPTAKCPSMSEALENYLKEHAQ